MKHLIFGFTTAVLFSGCAMTSEASKSSTPDSDRAETYAVQIVEANIPANAMVDLHAELFWNPDEEQIEDVEMSPVQDLFAPTNGAPSNAPDKPRHLPRPAIAQQTIDRILALPDADTYEYPVLHARTGETVICDQTETKEMIKDIKVVDGQTVKTMESVNLGHYAEIALQQATESGLSCSLKVESKILVGTETSTLENGDRIEMPFYDGFSMSSGALPLSEEWSMQALSIGEPAQNGITSGTAHLLFVRILPPEIQTKGRP